MGIGGVDWYEGHKSVTRTNLLYFMKFDLLYTIRLFGMGQNQPIKLNDLDRVEIADLQANSTADTDIVVDQVGLAACAGDGVGGAVARADRAAGAGVRNDLVRNQGFADLGRAAFFFDMRFIFVTEILERGFYRG